MVLHPVLSVILILVASSMGTSVLLLNDAKPKRELLAELFTCELTHDKHIRTLRWAYHEGCHTWLHGVPQLLSVPLDTGTSCCTWEEHAYFVGACCRSLCNVSAVLVLVFRLHICLALDHAIFGIVLRKVCSRYKPATTWLQGVPYLVPACVLNLASVSVVHPKSNIKLLLSLPQYYVML